MPIDLATSAKDTDSKSASMTPQTIYCPPLAQRETCSHLPPGMRAFTILTPHVAAGVGGFVLPGNHVDVLLTTTTTDAD